jgi:hypothetical protein
VIGVAEPLPYPRHLEADVVLRDGSTVSVRPVRAEDEGSLYEFLAGLSMDSRWLRFFGSANLEQQAAPAASVDYVNRR